MSRFPNPPKGWNPNHPHGCWMDNVAKPMAINFKSFSTRAEAQKWADEQDKESIVQFDTEVGDWTVTLTSVEK